MLFAIPEKDLLFALEAVDYVRKHANGIKSEIIEVAGEIKTDKLEIIFNNGRAVELQFADIDNLNAVFIRIVNALHELHSPTQYELKVGEEGMTLDEALELDDDE